MPSCFHRATRYTSRRADCNTSPVVWGVLLACNGFCFGCTDQYDDTLAVKDSSPSEVVGGSGGSGSSGSSGSSGGSGRTGGSGGTAGDAGIDGQADTDGGENDSSSDVAEEVLIAESGFVPDGRSVFTVFHGIPNATHLRVCFEAQESTGFAPLAVRPLPDDPDGLEYGRAFSLTELEGIDLETQAIRPVVYTGTLAEIGTARCNALNPLPTGLSRYTLQVIPAGTLARGRSVLLAFAGCVAGSSYTASVLNSVCGNSYAASNGIANGNVTMMMASMARSTPAEAIGIQVFVTFLGTLPLGLDHMTATPPGAIKFGSNVYSGAIAPIPPSTALPKSKLGTNPGLNRLRVFFDTAPTPAVSVLLTEALERGGLSLDSLQNGTNYTVVLAGPTPGVEGLWHEPHVVTVLSSDPD